MAHASTPLPRALLVANVIESLNVGGRLAFRFHQDPNASTGNTVGFRKRFGPQAGERITISSHSQAAYNGIFFIINITQDSSGYYYTVGDSPTDTLGVTFSDPAGTGGTAAGSEPTAITQPITTDPEMGGAVIKKVDGTLVIVGGGSGGSGGGSALTVQDEGSSLSNAATVLNFTGSGVTATGGTGTKTINIPGGAGQNIWEGINAYDDDAGGWQLTAPGQTPTTPNSQLRFIAGDNTRINLSGTDPLQVNIGFQEKVEVVNSAQPISSETTIAICLSDSHCTAIAKDQLYRFHIEGNNTEFVDVAADTIRVPRSRYHFLTTGDRIRYRDPDAPFSFVGQQAPAAIGGLSYNTQYYVIKVGSLSPSPTSNDRYSPHYIKLAASESDALAGTAITLTGLGQGPHHRFDIQITANSPAHYQKYYKWWGGYTTPDSDFEGSDGIQFDYTQYTGLVNLPRPGVGKKLTLIIPWRASGIDDLRGISQSMNPSTLGVRMGGYGALQFICSVNVDAEGNPKDSFIGNDLLEMNTKFSYFPTAGSALEGQNGRTVTGDCFVLCEPEQYRIDYINMLRSFAAEYDFLAGDKTPAQWHALAKGAKKGARSAPDLGHIVIELVGVPALDGSHTPESGLPADTWRPDIPPELHMPSANGEPVGQHYNNNAEVPVVGAVDAGSGEEPPGFTSAYFPAIWAISTPNHITQSDLRENVANHGIYTDYRTALGGRGGRGGVTMYDNRSPYYHILAREYFDRGGS